MSFPVNDKRVLMIAYHYPPVRVSSGIQRTLKFSAYLREHGWEPMVLTVSPRAYEQVSNDQMSDIPEGMVVERAFGLDTQRHLSIKGRYFRWMAQPDRWVSWWPMGVIKGLRMIRRYRPKAIMATYPIATSHLIGLTLHRLTGLPFVADFRDAMTEPDYPRDPMTWAVHRRLEQSLVKHCAKAVFTTRGTLNMYAERYPDIPAERWAIIENGFDDENFREAESGLDRSPLGAEGQMVLVHSGVLYPQERDPRPFFAALKHLKASGEVSAATLKVILRATGTDDLYRKMIVDFEIDDIVKIEPMVAYRAALQEMMRADGLLLFQAIICNHQIPAKLYEYARAGQPILGLTDLGGNTAELLGKLGCPHVADIARADSILPVLRDFIAQWRSGQLKGIRRDLADSCSRRSRTDELARLLDSITN
jgi:hypothetical protein